MKSVYIHIPFCTSICSYCDFSKVLYKEDVVTNYLNALEKEINGFYDNEIISTIYIGGGTPSCLSISNLERLFEIIKVFKLNDIYEFTFEVNVNDITEELVEFLYKNKVNRISVGVESFEEKNLKYLNRKHTKKEIFNNISLLKKYFNDINIDIIYAIPIESLNEVKSDIKNFLKLDIPHISAYSLIIENNTVLGIKNVSPISEEEDYKMYEYIVKKLKKNEYIHYEVSNFAKPGFESEHNLNYWNNGEYYGFGLGAHGYINGVRYENTKNLTKYLNYNFKVNELFISKQEEMENEVILGLRKIEGINIEKFFNKFEINIQDVFNIMPLLKDKLLIIENKNLKIPEDKIYIMNEILCKILTKEEICQN